MKPEKELDLLDLYYQRRIDTESMGIKEWTLLALYFPFGVMLAVIRLIGGFLVALVCPSRFRPGLLSIGAGFIRKLNGVMDMPEQGAVLASNHSTYLDYLVISAALKTPRSFSTAVWYGVEAFVRVFCRPVVPIYFQGKNREFLRSVRKVLKERNLIIFPEASITNGCAGILTFEKACFSLGAPVYLVAIKYHRALPFIRPKAMSTKLLFEMAVELFQPWTVVTINAIGPVERQKGEKSEEVAARAQQAVAAALSLSATRYSGYDRYHYLMKSTK